MMNRIILIGNGFDRAHGLLTGYDNFIKNYSDCLINTFKKSGGQFLSIKDELLEIAYQNNTIWSTEYENIRTIVDLQDYIHKHGEKSSFKFRSKYFERIYKNIQANKWVDIENEYYTLLKLILNEELGDRRPYKNPKILNDDLANIQKLLIQYLTQIQESINPELVKDNLQNTIYEPIDVNDISITGNEALEIFLNQRWDDLKNEINRKLLFTYSVEPFGNEHDITKYIDREKTFDKHLKNVYDKQYHVPKYFLLPDQILLLNFNYTKTADLYIPQGSQFKVNHIHGELNNDNNPIIFGYGDELDEDYKSIANLNDNEYLKNIKSIRYLETDNYRQLLRFIGSAPYQIYIMGHSCGNSDRTLLNTLFEHRNCLSIKPFYHKKEDGTDNYIDIVQNISRDFNDMTLMRDRVVNKGYCRPLVEPVLDRC